MEKPYEDREIEHDIERKQSIEKYRSMLQARTLVFLVIGITALYIINIYLHGIPGNPEQAIQFTTKIRHAIIYATLIILALLFYSNSEVVESSYLTPTEAIHIAYQEMKKRSLSQKYGIARGDVVIGEYTTREAMSSKGVPKPWYYAIGFQVIDNVRFIRKYYEVDIYASGIPKGQVKAIKQLVTDFDPRSKPDIIKISPGVYEMWKDLKERNVDKKK